MRLVFASNNPHKLDEVRSILGNEVEVVRLAEIGFHKDIEETGDTLEENSLLKAQTVWKYLHAQGGHTADGVFADDTGLEIHALGGRPGVRTARWAADESARQGIETADHSSAANRQLALRLLAGKMDRDAQFRTVVTYIHADGRIRQVEGIVKGTIATEERGGSGFGYDPIFIPEGYDKTFAELPAEVKNSISHRARAVYALQALLAQTEW